MKSKRTPKTRTIYGLKCPNCGDEIYSLYRHDFTECKCGDCFIDGGQDDCRRIGFKDVMPTTVKKRVKIADFEIAAKIKHISNSIRD